MLYGTFIIAFYAQRKHSLEGLCFFSLSWLFRLSTKLLRLKQGSSSAGRDGELEDTIQELEARVATLESQKGALQSKLSLAKQHILDLGVRTHYRPRTGEGSLGMIKW